MILPNPFTTSAEPVSHTLAEPADASPSASPGIDASADLSAKSERGPEELPAADALNPHETAGAFPSLDDCIEEIFIGTLKLDRRFDDYFDEPAFMEALEEPPLFLRQA
jgi:hypothetical protein